METPENNNKKTNPNMMGATMAIGVGVGTALGVALDNLAVGVAVGAGVGVASVPVFPRGTIHDQVADRN